MAREVQEEELNAKQVVQEMVATAKKIDQVMQTLCKEKQSVLKQIAKESVDFVTLEELIKRKQSAELAPKDYLDWIKTDMRERGVRGWKLPMDLVQNQPFLIKEIGELRNNDKIIYHINDIPIPPMSSVNQLMEAIATRLRSIDCTLNDADAEAIANRLQWVAQDSDERILQAARALFPSNDPAEWRTGTVVVNANVFVGLHENSWGLGVSMEHEAIIKCRVNDAISSAIRAKYFCSFHRDSSSPVEDDFLVTRNYVALSDLPQASVPLASVVRRNLSSSIIPEIIDVVDVQRSSSFSPLPFNQIFGRTRIVSCASSQVHTLFLSDIGSVFALGKSDDGALGLGALHDAKSPQLIEFDDLNIIVQVDAGGDVGAAHSIALTSEGEVFTWGARVACGTIGPPQCEKPQKIHFEDIKFVQVAAGDAFSMSLTDTGNVYTWGRFNNGRLGLGTPPKRSAASRGVRNDQLLQPFPQRILDFSNGSQISCGAAHACCITFDGKVFSWGKNSNGQLGIGHLLDMFSPTIVAFPQKEKILAFQQVSCGRDFTLALDREGSVWWWGAGLSESLPPPANMSKKYDLPAWEWLRPQRLLALGSRIKSISAGTYQAGAITISGDSFLWGKQPQSDVSSIPHLAHPSRLVEFLSCGKENVWALTAETFLGRSMHELWRQKFCCDLVILVSGRRIQAHQVILSYRCPKLRDLITQETRANDDVVELILPTLRYDVCLLLLEFIYTDTLYTRIIDPSSCLPNDLLRVSEEFELPGLGELCSKYMATNAQDSNQQPPPNTQSLTTQLQQALGSSLYSDITLVAEGQHIHAHKCILAARSDYFRALFLTNMRESSWKILNVGISYSTMQRVLSFIYSDAWECPESEDVLIDDLIAADKYGISRLKVLCEEHAQLTLENCMELLVLADMIHAHLLHEKAIAFILDQLYVLAEAPSFIQLAQEYPKLMHEIIHHPSRNKDRMLWQTYELDEAKKKLQEDANPGFPLTPFVFLVAFGISFLHVSSQFPQLGSSIPAINAIAFVGLCVYCFRELISV